jgi:hypothetical protein
VAKTVVRSREELAADFSDLDRQFSALIENHDRAQLTWRPAEGAWSVAECIEHVARTNGVYVPEIEKAIAGSHPVSGSREEGLHTAGWPSAYFLKAIGPKVTRHLPAPALSRPAPADAAATDPKAVLSDLLATHQRIRRLLAGTSQPDLNLLRFKNPFVPLLRWTAATGLLIMAAHGRRHLLQAQRVVAMPAFTRAASVSP